MEERLEIPIEIFENVKYDENSPSGLIWIKPKQRRKVGGVAGNKNNEGYWQIGFNGKYYYCHRVIYKMFNKINIQHTEIDHHNKKKDNNKIENLRVATSSEQNSNKRIYKNNTSGIKGVVWNKKDNKWRAQINKNGKQYHLGSFDCKYEAEKVVIKTRDELHKDFASHGN